MGKSKKRNPNTLSLSLPQKVTCDIIRGRIKHFMNIAAANHINNMTMRFAGDLLEELNYHKIYLEELFSDTDIKNEKIKLLQDLLRIEQLISSGSSEDYGCYTKMALQMKPEDGHFNFRNEMKIFIKQSVFRSSLHPNSA